MGGVQPNMPQPGLPTPPQAPAPVGPQQQMAGPTPGQIL